MAVQTKSAGLALFLSLIFPGLGQLYNGNAGKGTTLIVLSVISIALLLALIGFLIYPIIWLYGMVDAYNEAGRINAVSNQQLIANRQYYQQQYPPAPQPQYPQQYQQPQYPSQQISQPYREKEIITREIVKIPCSYCNQLVDITQNKCPNCGANAYRRS
jgi:TM2 domain-containing membrane protein YozV